MVLPRHQRAGAGDPIRWAPGTGVVAKEGSLAQTISSWQPKSIDCCDFKKSRIA